MSARPKVSGWCLTNGLIFTALVASAVAAAADAPQQPSDSSTAPVELQEVVVTAEKRETSLQHTPVAVTAVSQASLLENGVDEVTSLQKVAPDVNITNSSAGPTVDIRGLYTTQGNNPGSEGVVAEYFDGAYLTEVVMQGLLFDLERVEVVKGPQTTLFGKDAVAGAINFVSSKPVLGSSSGDAQLEFGSYSTIRAEAAQNIPVADTFALRVAAQSYSHNGYMQSGLDDANTQSGRLSGLWEPNDKEQLLIVGDYSVDNARDDEGIVSNVVGVQPGISDIYVPTNPRNDTFYDGYVDGPNSPFYRHSQLGGLTLQNDYSFDFATWTTIAAYRRYSLNWVYPTDATQGPLATAPDGGTYPSGARSFVPQVNQSKSFETRLASTSTAPIAWLGGLYVYADDSHGTMIAYPNTTATAQSLQIGNPYEYGLTGAVYGQATYTPESLSALHITAGGRWEADHKEQRDTFTQFGPFTVADIPSSSDTWRHGSYKAEVSYDVAKDSMVYADTATAFRAGGYSYGVGQNATAGPIYLPEYITSYEGGLKNRFFDQRLQVNVEGWTYNYTNFENVLVFFQCTPVCGGLPAITTGNAGKAQYHGASIDIDYLLTDDDELKLTDSWLNAKYGTYVQQVSPGFSLAPGPVPVESNGYLSNTDITNVPHASAIGSYSHSFRNVWGGGTIVARVAGQYQSARVLDLEDDPVYGIVSFRAPAWAMGDASLQYQSKGIWSAQVYCHNFTNNTVPVAGAYSTSTYAYTEAFYPPRVFGAMIEAHW
jgi:iron complex outermembrane receptor protein